MTKKIKKLKKHLKKEDVSKRVKTSIFLKKFSRYSSLFVVIQRL